ncbi:hypothetical protein I4U23_010896 [Adineta vaga]|nr:hypothetical protein I4U23_010896 [Adineta vaga]
MFILNYNIKRLNLESMKCLTGLCYNITLESDKNIVLLIVSDIRSALGNQKYRSPCPRTLPWTVEDRSTCLYSSSLDQHCDFSDNNGFHCYNSVVEFLCEHCTKKFCYDHLTEHEHIEENKENETNLNAPSPALYLDEEQLYDTQKSSSTICEASLYFQPIAASTQISSNDHHSIIELDMLDGNHYLIDDVPSLTTNNEEYISHVTKNEPMDALPAGIISNDFISTLESSIKENSTTKKRKRTLQNESSIKENDERLNRVNFFLKDIHTSKTYVDIFASIATMYQRCPQGRAYFEILPCPVFLQGRA